jgi:hypothetical protein
MVNFPFDDIEFTAEPARPERVEVPEGVHEFRIEQVLEDDQRLEVRLVHDDRRYGWVFCKLPKDKGWAKRLVGQLAGALAIGPDDWASSEAGDLVGRRVRADIVHRQGDRLWVNVDKFLPIEQLADEAAVVAKRPARTPAAKVKAASPAIGSDDIPFALLLAVIASLIGGVA